MSRGRAQVGSLNATRTPKSPCFVNSFTFAQHCHFAGRKCNMFEFSAYQLRQMLLDFHSRLKFGWDGD